MKKELPLEWIRILNAVGGDMRDLQFALVMTPYEIVQVATRKRGASGRQAARLALLCRKHKLSMPDVSTPKRDWPPEVARTGLRRLAGLMGRTYTSARGLALGPREAWNAEIAKLGILPCRSPAGPALRRKGL